MMMIMVVCSVVVMSGVFVVADHVVVISLRSSLRLWYLCTQGRVLEL